MGSDLGGLGLELFLFLIGEAERLSLGVVLALLFEAQELDLVDVLLADLFDMFGVIATELCESALGDLGVLRRIRVPPAADEIAGLKVLVVGLVVVVVRGVGGGGEGAEGFGELGGCTVERARGSHWGRVQSTDYRSE